MCHVHKSHLIINLITSCFSLRQVTLEQEMICGAISTLNEDAFDDVSSQNPNVQSNGSTGELCILQQQYLAPISESVESPTLSRSCESFFPEDANQLQIVNNSLYNNNNNSSSNRRLDETTVIIMPNFSASTSNMIDDTRL